MLDRAVLAGGVDALQDDEDGMLRLGPDPVLEIRQAVEPALQVVRGVSLRVAVRVIRVEIGQTNPGGRIDAEDIAKGSLGRRHRSSSWPRRGSHGGFRIGARIEWHEP